VRFDGWRIVVMMLAAQTLTTGATTYAYSLFLKPIGAEFGVDPSRLAFGQSVFLILMMPIGLVAGVALDRRSIRALVIAGALVFAAGLALMAAAASLAALFAVYCTIVSAGALLAGPVPANKLVVSWFLRMRGRALGVASIGTSAGGVLMPPLCAWAIGAFGWRHALLLVGGVTLAVIVPSAWWFIANRPEDRGQLPDGDPVPARVDPIEERRVPLLPLLRERNYWGIALAFGLAWAVISSLLSFFHVYTERLGIGPGASARVMALFSAVAVPGKVLFGAAAERIDRRWLVWLGLALQLSYVAVLRSEPSYGVLLAASVVFGISLGGLLPMYGALVAEYYGRTSFASVMSAIGPVMTTLMFSVIALGSWLPAVTGSYARLFDVFLALQALAILALGLLRPVRSS
jgi:MFS family permease